MPEHPQIIIQEKQVSSGVGLAAIILGVLGIVFGIIFVPFGLLFSVIAIFKRQIALGIVGLLCNLFALVSSIWFWALLGISAGFSFFSYMHEFVPSLPSQPETEVNRESNTPTVTTARAVEIRTAVAARATTIS